MQAPRHDELTSAVIDQMATTADPRLREIMAAGVRHLHAFAREVELKPEEWLAGISFLTAVGRMCTPERQEFILLSDTLGLSALVNQLNDRATSGDATPGSLLGPFYRENAPRLANGASLTTSTDATNEIALWGHVTDLDGAPIAGADVSIWQTGADGLYDIQVEGRGTDCRGVLSTEADGAYWARTVKPLGYSIPMDGPVGQLVAAQGRHGMRPAHIHVLVSAPGYRELVTALYVEGDPHIADDVVFGTERELVVAVTPSDPACPLAGLASIRFDVRLAKADDSGESGRVGADPAAIVKGRQAPGH